MCGQILVVDDDQNLCEAIEADLRLRGFAPSWCTASDAAFAALAEHDFDVVLTDLNMPGMDGLELCDRIVANRPDIPVVVITAFGTMDTAIAAIRAGAYDFVNKPIEMDMLALTLKRAVRHRMLQEKVKVLSEEVASSQAFQELIGESRAIRDLFDKIARVGDADASVLITGESGMIYAIERRRSRLGKVAEYGAAESVPLRAKVMHRSLVLQSRIGGNPTIGRAICSPGTGGSWNATAIFSGLPVSNSGFGRRTCSVDVLRTVFRGWSKRCDQHVGRAD